MFMAIAYSNITLKQIYDEVILRLAHHRNEVNVDFLFVARMINRAIKEIIAWTLPYKDWSYVSDIVVSNGSGLGRSYIKFINVLLSTDGATDLRDARYADATEFNSLTNAYTAHSWNLALEFDPIFTIWSEGTQSELKIYTAPSTFSGIMQAYYFPSDYYSPTDVLPIPYEYEDLLVSNALQRILLKTTNIVTASQLTKFIERDKMKIIQQFIEKKKTEEVELRSFTEEDKREQSLNQRMAV